MLVLVIRVTADTELIADMHSAVPTTFFVISDSHGQALEHKLPIEKIDVAIHCGDLTEESKLSEFRATLDMLGRVDATLKLVIASNHDWTLDDRVFKHKLTELKRVYGDTEDMDAMVEREYGRFGDARALLQDARACGIFFLDEGIHEFTLANGARLKVFTSPFTPSPDADWGFQYDSVHGRAWTIHEDVELAITHSPPRGVFDTCDGVRVGCPDLFKAIARARPRMHCFGHVHSGWGARLVAWRESPTEEPSHFTDIDGSQTRLIENVSSVTANGERDSAELLRDKQRRYDRYQNQGYCDHTDTSDDLGLSKTLFVNAALENKSDSQQFPWLIKLNLISSDEQALSKSAPVTALDVADPESHKPGTRKASQTDAGEGEGRPLKSRQS